MPDLPSKFSVDKMAQLARLDLSSEERSKLADELTAVLDFAAQIECVAVEAEEQPRQIVESECLREDVSRPSLTSEAALQNAPAQAHQRFVVPPVFG